MSPKEAARDAAYLVYARPGFADYPGRRRPGSQASCPVLGRRSLLGRPGMQAQLLARRRLVRLLAVKLRRPCAWSDMRSSSRQTRRRTVPLEAPRKITAPARPFGASGHGDRRDAVDLIHQADYGTARRTRIRFPYNLHITRQPCPRELGPLRQSLGGRPSSFLGRLRLSLDPGLNPLTDRCPAEWTTDRRCLLRVQCRSAGGTVAKRLA